MSNQAAIAIMARAPNGRYAPKSRLRHGIPEEADRRDLYRGFLLDTLTACRGIANVTVHVAYAPDGGMDGFETLDLSPSDLLAQRGNDLGTRQCGVFEDLFDAGYSTVLVIGSDLPTLPVQYIEDALSKVNDSLVVLGPSEDGGYYLMGLTAPRKHAPVPDLFTNIRWSTASALEDTIHAAERTGLTVSEVASWYDIDTVDGLSRLQEDLTTAKHIQRAPETARTLRRITSR